MHFVEDRTLFSVDLLSIGSTNFMLGWRDNIFPNNLETIKSLQKLELEYDYLFAGHYPLQKKEVVAQSRQYLEDIRDGVMTAIKAGKNLQETVESVKLVKYKNLRRYDLLGLNVASVYTALTKKDSEFVREIHKEESEYMGLTKYIGNPDQAKVACVPCHRMNGISRYDIYPNLAGQNYEYLHKSLRDYDSRSRFDPVMSSMDYMSDRDLDDIAKQFSMLELPQPHGELNEKDKYVENARQIAEKSCVACHGQRGEFNRPVSQPVGTELWLPAENLMKL